MNPPILLGAVELFIFSISAFGLAFISGFSKISLPIRSLIDPGNKVDTAWKLARLFVLTLIECPACLGFWIGLLYGGIRLGIFAGLMLGLYTCGANYILARLTSLVPPEGIPADE